MSRIELSKRSVQQNLLYERCIWDKNRNKGIKERTDYFTCEIPNDNRKIEEGGITGGNSNKDSDHMYHGRGNRMDHIQRH